MKIKTVRAEGIECLNLATTLLQRVRVADPSFGVWEAADVQWWWRRPRSSDLLPQKFWIDRTGPVAVGLMTDWDTSWQLDPIVLPSHVTTLLPAVMKEALARADQIGATSVDVLARDDDDAMIRVLTAAGSSPGSDYSGSTWMQAGDVPDAPPLPDGYRWTDRQSRRDGSHWLRERSGPDVEERLAACSLYDPELDMAVETDDGEIAAYALFWHDPVTSVGMIEPMRTEDAHRHRGLARALLGEGLARLVARGATRLKVGYSTEPALALYTSSGFEPTDVCHAYRLRVR